MPLAGGAFVLGLFAATRSPLVGLAGLLWIWAALAFAAAAVVLAAFGWRDARRAGLSARARLLPAGAVLAVLLVDCAAAGGALWCGVWLWNRSTIEFANEAATPWGPLRVTGPGLDVQVEALGAGASTSVTVSFAHDGICEVFDASTERVASLGYVTNGLPIEGRIVRRTDGSVHAEAAAR